MISNRHPRGEQRMGENMRTEGEKIHEEKELHVEYRHYLEQMNETPM